VQVVEVFLKRRTSDTWPVAPPPEPDVTASWPKTHSGARAAVEVEVGTEVEVGAEVDVDKVVVVPAPDGVLVPQPMTTTPPRAVVATHPSTVTSLFIVDTICPPRRQRPLNRW
jgi:hypothetical protein